MDPLFGGTGTILNSYLLLRRCLLMIFLSRALVTTCLVELNHMCNFDRGPYEEHFCVIILNLDQRGNVVKKRIRYFLSKALAALLFCRVKSFV